MILLLNTMNLLCRINVLTGFVQSGKIRGEKEILRKVRGIQGKSGQFWKLFFLIWKNCSKPGNIICIFFSKKVLELGLGTFKHRICVILNNW